MENRDSGKKPTNIYGLIDPRDSQLRYVGKTVKPVEERVGNHISFARAGKLQRVSRWIRGILMDGLEPEWFALEVTPAGDDWQEAERFWIAYFRSLGCRLTNLTNGGEGCEGFRHSEEFKTALSLRNSATESIEKAREGLARWKDENPDWRKLVGASIKRTLSSPSVKEKQSKAIKLAYSLHGHAKVISAKKQAWWDDPANDNKKQAMAAAVAVKARMREPKAGYKGVTKNYDKWSARIFLDGERVSLGAHDTPELAALAYDKAAVDAWGIGNCYLNFPNIHQAANDNQKLDRSA